MITRMTSDINLLQNGVNMALRLFLRSPFVVFGAMIMAFTIDFKAALSFVGAIILLSIVVFGIMYLNIPMMKSVQAKLDDVLLTARENLTGIRVIRAFCKEDEELARFRQKNEELTRMQKVRFYLRTDQPADLCHHQLCNHRAHLDRCTAGTEGYSDTGSGGSTV